MTRYDAFMICTSPRSGSTLLCKLLSATAVAGNPQSWFYGTSLDDWLEDLDVVPKPGDTEQEVLEAVFRAAVKKGSDGKGPFGLRQQGESFPFLFEKLKTLFREETTDVGRFQCAFGQTLFIHLTRQTGLWHVAPDGTELERVAPHQEPTYDHQKVRACIDMLVAYERVWSDWFVREGIAPLRISYEDLAADPIAVLRHILIALGQDQSAANDVRPGVKKLADNTNREWAMRFRAELRLADG
jgi:trehalose 2-sulfotransferase